jgi:NAD(P)-dependent dehydrogenase (short-subunit alcohol dehydrogenase family)
MCRMRIEGSSAVITGGGSGLGAATARHLAEAGAHVVIADRVDSRGREVADELGTSATFTATDVRDSAAVAGAIATAVAAAPLRIAVACAGVAPGERIVGRNGPHDLERFREVIDVNLSGTFNLLRLAAAAMSENTPDEDGTRGVVVMTASVAAYEGQVGQAAYAASKGGVVSLTLTAARDLASRGIRVMTIAPGPMLTPMVAGFSADVRDSLAAQTVHPRRLGAPDEYAALVRHVCENEYLNGEVIRLDAAGRMPPK